MTKEELEKEAQQYALSHTTPSLYRVVDQAYLAGAEPREKQIAELEAQIEEMKCCENCAFFKDKTYDICHKIKKLGTRKCAFYKMI